MRGLATGASSGRASANGQAHQFNGPHWPAPQCSTAAPTPGEPFLVTPVGTWLHDDGCEQCLLARETSINRRLAGGTSSASDLVDTRAGEAAFEKSLERCVENAGVYLTAEFARRPAGARRAR